VIEECVRARLVVAHIPSRRLSGTRRIRSRTELLAVILASIRLLLACVAEPRSRLLIIRCRDADQTHRLLNEWGRCQPRLEPYAAVLTSQHGLILLLATIDSLSRMRPNLPGYPGCLFALFEAFIEEIGLHEAVEVPCQELAAYAGIERMRELLIQCFDLGL